MIRISWRTALLLLASGLLLFSGATHYQDTRSTVLHVEQVDPFRTPSFNVSIPQHNRVTRLSVTVDIATARGDYTSIIRFNGREIGRYTRSGEHTMTLSPSASPVELQERNTLAVQVQQHFGVEPLRFDAITVTARTPLLQWATSILSILGILVALFGACTVIILAAARYGHGRTTRYLLRQTVAVVLTIAAVGTFFSFLTGAAFIILEDPVAGPMLDDAQEDVHTAVEHTLWEQYGELRRTLCSTSFRLSEDCSLRTMEQQLADRQVETFGGIDRYFRDAALLAYARRVRAVAVANTSTDSFEPAVSQLLVTAGMSSQYGIIADWTRSSTAAIIDRCRANGTRAARCFDRAHTAFTTFDQRRVTADDPCRTLSFVEAVNRSHATSSNRVVATYIDIMAPPLSVEDRREIRQACPHGGRSMLVSEIVRMASAMSAATIYAESSTARMLQATRQIGDTMLHEVTAR